MIDLSTDKDVHIYFNDGSIESFKGFVTLTTLDIGIEAEGVLTVVLKKDIRKIVIVSRETTQSIEECKCQNPS